MSIWNYKSNAIEHVWEFLHLGLSKPEGLKLAYERILSEEKAVRDWLASCDRQVVALVEAIPSKREGLLKRMTEGRQLETSLLILGGWKHCRQAVLTFDWMIDNDYRFVPGDKYRYETARQGWMFEKVKAGKVSNWPIQWGKSPFKGERSRKDSWEMVDYMEELDNYNPSTGMF